MHIRKLTIQNIKSLRDVRWEIPQSKAKGWHVVLGNNGSGKSSFLRAICLALVGPIDGAGLRQPWADWLTKDQSTGSVEARLIRDPVYDEFAGQGRTPKNSTGLPAAITLVRNEYDNSQVDIRPTAKKPAPDRYLWGGAKGWFSASYGPFRRFSGGDVQSEKLFYSMPRLSRHLSLFDERVALTECLDWLRSLKFKSLEKDSEGLLLEKITTFLNNSSLLPSGVRIVDVSSKDVWFNDANGHTISAEQLSDGYRSILSMTFELMRQLALAFGPSNLFDPTSGTVVMPSGVVVIDEIDAHLHPTWQRIIGKWFCNHFPNIQFIVSTHSPLVCQSAENGTVFLLPPAGSQDDAHFVEGEVFKRLIFGNVLDAYGTEAFGSGAALTRSDSSVDKHERLAHLNNKEITEGLESAEQSEQEELRRTLPSAASSLT